MLESCVRSRGTDSSVTRNEQCSHAERTVRSRGTDSSVTREWRETHSYRGIEMCLFLQYTREYHVIVAS